jgi:hypothetical protein
MMITKAYRKKDDIFEIICPETLPQIMIYDFSMCYLYKAIPRGK